MYHGFYTGKRFCVPRSDAQNCAKALSALCAAQPMLARKRGFERNKLEVLPMALDNKYRVHEVAKDFGVSTKEITEILTK